MQASDTCVGPFFATGREIRDPGGTVIAWVRSTPELVCGVTSRLECLQNTTCDFGPIRVQPHGRRRSAMRLRSDWRALNVFK